MPRRVPTHRPPGQPTREQANRAYETTPKRLADQRFYKGAAWLKVRAVKIASDVLCERCPRDRPKVAEQVHHKVPRDVRPDLAYDLANLESLCRACHNAAKPEDVAHRRVGRG